MFDADHCRLIALRPIVDVSSVSLESELRGLAWLARRSPRGFAATI